MSLRILPRVSQVARSFNIRGYKVLYTAHVRSTGGRDGAAKSVQSDGHIDIKLRKPKSMGGNGEGTNPEELFAAGYSACFLGAMGVAAKNLKLDLPKDTSVTADVDLGVHDDKKLGIRVKLSPNLPGLSQKDAEAIVQEAHTICPYSHATRNNVEVTFSTTNN